MLELLLPEFSCSTITHSFYSGPITSRNLSGTFSKMLFVVISCDVFFCFRSSCRWSSSFVARSRFSELWDFIKIALWHLFLEYISELFLWIIICATYQILWYIPLLLLFSSDDSKSLWAWTITSLAWRSIPFLGDVVSDPFLSCSM